MQYILLTEHTVNFKTDFRSQLNGLASSQHGNEVHWTNFFTQNLCHIRCVRMATDFSTMICNAIYCF